VLLAIESALNQGNMVREIIVVDDASTDDTKEAVKKAFPQVKIVTTPKRIGPGPARNLGVQNSTGEIIMFLDSDDIWHNNHCKLLLEAMDPGFHAAYGITKNRNLRDGSSFFIPESDHLISGECLNELFRWCFMVPSSFAVTRKAFMEVGGFEAFSPGEDWFFFLKLARRYPFAAVPEIITLRFLHEGSISCRFFDKKSAGRMLLKLKKFAADYRCSQEEIARIDNMIEFTERYGATCQSVQDWYLSMKGKGLV